MEETPTATEPVGPVMEKLQNWAAGPNPAVNTPDAKGRVASFGLGFWHGATAPVALVLALFKEEVHVFEVHNTGNGYIAGFVLGLLTIWGGSHARAHAGARHWRRG